MSISLCQMSVKMSDSDMVISNVSNESEAAEVYKLYYFPVMALAEPIRYLLSYGNIKFEDIRLDPEKWKAMKETTPFGQLPILEMNGKIAYQSLAICRYLANIVGLAGNHQLENLEIDAIVDSISEFRSHISSYNKLEDGEEKNELKKKLSSVTIPYYLEKFNNISENGFMALGKLTWADLYLVSILDYCDGVMKSSVTEGYKNLEKLRHKILHIPSIKKWIEIRPISDY